MNEDYQAITERAGVDWSRAEPFVGECEVPAARVGADPLKMWARAQEWIGKNVPPPWPHISRVVGPIKKSGSFESQVRYRAAKEGLPRTEVREAATRHWTKEDGVDWPSAIREAKGEPSPEVGALLESVERMEQRLGGEPVPGTPAYRWTGTGLKITGDLVHEDCRTIWRLISDMGRSSAFGVGDQLLWQSGESAVCDRCGEMAMRTEYDTKTRRGTFECGNCMKVFTRYPRANQPWGHPIRAYEMALEFLPLAHSTLKNAKAVCREFPPYRRRYALLPGHYHAVASLPPKDQDEWLARASQSEVDIDETKPEGYQVTKPHWSVKKLRDRVRAWRDGTGTGEFDVAQTYRLALLKKPVRKRDADEVLTLRKEDWAEKLRPLIFPAGVDVRRIVIRKD